MTYLALARKYRPIVLDELIGQAHLVRTLKNAIGEARVHHAYLFCGARGVGKTTTARIMARSLNCADGPTATPCGTCAPCRQILAGHCNDVSEIDGASNTGVDSVRELRDSVRYAPILCRTKVYIIDEVHMLSQAAFNALLKTLEEPPPHVLFIFATTEPHKIPATILSRCQRFDLRRVPEAQLLAHMQALLGKEGQTLSAATLQSVTREAQGSVRDGLSLLDQVLSFVGGEAGADDAEALDALGILRHEVIFALWDALLDGDAARTLRLLADVDGRGFDLGRLAQALAEHGRDLSVAKALQAPDAAVLDRAPAHIEALRAQAARRSHSDLQRLFFEAARLAEDVGRATLPRATMEMACLRLLSLPQVSDLRTLLERLAAAPAPAAGSATPVALPPPTMPAAAPPAPVRQATSTAVAGGSIDNSAWQRFVERVRRAKPAIGSVLEHGRVVRFEPTGVIVAYEPHSFYWDAAHEKETQEHLHAHLQEQFGQAVPLQVVEAGAQTQAGESLAEVARRAQQTYETTVKQQAENHPAVQQAVSTLDASLEQVRSL